MAAGRVGIRDRCQVLPRHPATWPSMGQARGRNVHLIGGADVAAELDAKRAIAQGSRLAAIL